MSGNKPADEDNPLGRRDFIGRLGGAGAVAAAGIGLNACANTAEPAASATGNTADDDASLHQTVPTTQNVAARFNVDRQAGVTRPVAPAGLVVAFDANVNSVEELAETLQDISSEIKRLTDGIAATEADDYRPPVDSGVVGSTPTAGTSITMAVGASLFDDRFGLADLRPRELIAMPRFRNDRQMRADLTHGDLAFVVSAQSNQAGAHALHQLVRIAGNRLTVRWVQEGYNDLLPSQESAPTRNLMGFKDGISNLDSDDASVMNEHVWVQPDDDEPEWATNGTYVAVRVIRMFIEFWATAALVRQEQIFGRHRGTGAPLGQEYATDEPGFASDRLDEEIPRRSHLRLANPRTPGTGRILRRGFSYLNGAATDGTIDQGLLFIAYQRALSTGFVEVQSRLDGEPLEDYVKPVGGGFWFVVPGPGSAPDAWLGHQLFASSAK